MHFVYKISSDIFRIHLKYMDFRIGNRMLVLQQKIGLLNILYRPNLG